MANGSEKDGDSEPRGKAGRPSKLTPEIRAVAVRAFRSGFGVMVAASICGVDKRTFLRWRKADADFAAQLVAARGSGTQWVMAQLLAQIGRGSTKAAIWWLEATCPQFKAAAQQRTSTQEAEKIRTFVETIVGRRPKPPDQLPDELPETTTGPDDADA